MATTTPNYGWAVPTSTDLVKDGATAIETLGDAIDASMNTALGTKKAGMVLLNTTSFSGVASVSVNDVFSATYDNYVVYIKSTPTGGSGLNSIRLRVGGADNSSNDYRLWYADPNSSSTSFSGATGNPTSVFRVGVGRSGNADNTILNVMSPFVATQTQIIANNTNYDGTVLGALTTWGTMSVTTSYTGFTFTTPANAVGTIRIYGVNQ